MRWTLWLAVALLIAGFPQASARSDEVRWSGEVVLGEDHVVPKGATLIIAPGTVVRSREFAVDPPREPGARLVVEGRLVAIGTANAPIRFFTEARLLRADGSALDHVAFDASSAEGCALSSWETTYRVERSRFTNNTWALCIEGGDVLVRGNTFLYNAYMPDASEYPPCVQEDVSGSPGVSTACPPPGYMGPGAPGEPYRCWIAWSGRELCRGSGGTDMTIALGWGSATIEDNLFASNMAGPYVHRNASATIRNNTFVDNDHGVRVDASFDPFDHRPPTGRRVVVEGNTFERNGDANATFVWSHSPGGLIVQGRIDDQGATRDVGEILVRDNRFVENGVGALVRGDALAVRFERNLFTGNGVGFASEHGRSALRECSFVGSRQLDLLLVGGWGSVDLSNTTFDPAKVRIEGEAEVRWEGGVIRNVTLAFLLGSMVAAALALATEAGRWAAIAAYARIAKSSLLEHGTREAILRDVQAQPGLHLRDLARRVGSYGAAVHHLARLEREGYLRSRREGLRRRFYPAGPLAPDDPLAPLARRLHDLVGQTPGIALADAAREMGVSRQLARHHAQALVRAGLATMQRAGRGTTLRQAPERRPSETRSAPERILLDEPG